MKTIESRFTAPRLAAAVAALFAGTTLLSATATALTSGTAANTTVRNIVTVSFADSANVAQTDVEAAVDVTVALVTATPTLALTSLNTYTIEPNQTATYTFTLQTNANGPDEYTMTTTESSPSPAGFTATSSNVGPYTLGATSIVSAVNNVGNNWTLTVASDDTATSGDINELAEGDTVMIDGVACTIDASSMTDTGTAAIGPGPTYTQTTNSSFDVSCAAAVTPAYGELVQERVSFSVVVDPTNYIAPSDNSIVTTTSATDGVNPADSEAVTTVVSGLDLVVAKYVRCVSAAPLCVEPAPGGGDPVIGATQYFAGGVEAQPTATLEYIVSINNPLGNSTAKDVLVEDPIPPFTSFVADSAAILDSTGAVIVDDAGTAPDSCQMDTAGDACQEVSGTLYFYVGSNLANLGEDDDALIPDGDGTRGGGVMPGDTTSYARFQVTID
jgi:uncharacterized repeat protein (TIGR01451 family)